MHQRKVVAPPECAMSCSWHARAALFLQQWRSNPALLQLYRQSI
jgi:hypothetical protein